MSIERNLRLALHQLVEAIGYTPMGVRGIKAVANARKALEAAQQPATATATACGIPGMAKTTCPYCEQGFAFEHEQPATGEPVAWLHVCRKKPELRELSFSKAWPNLAALGYKARPLVLGDTHPAPSVRGAGCGAVSLLARHQTPRRHCFERT